MKKFIVVRFLTEENDWVLWAKITVVVLMSISTLASIAVIVIGLWFKIWEESLLYVALYMFELIFFPCMTMHIYKKIKKEVE